VQEEAAFLFFFLADRLQELSVRRTVFSAHPVINTLHGQEDALPFLVVDVRITFSVTQ